MVMSLLDGLFEQTEPELPVADDVVTADASVEPGYLHRIAGSDDPITVTMIPHTLDDVAGTRFAVKVYAEAPAPPGGTLTIVVPVGQQIEANSGELGDGVVLADQTLGTFREWLCDAEGVWRMVGGGW